MLGRRRNLTRRLQPCRTLPGQAVFYCWLALGIGAVCSRLAVADAPVRATDLKFDVLHLQSRIVQGRVLKEGPEGVTLQLIYVNPGRPIRIEEAGPPYPWASIKRFERLSPAERERLSRFLVQKQSEREKFKRLLAAIELKPAPWGKSPVGGLSYSSKRFTLLSNARPDIVRRGAERLEQIYAAFDDFLPPRHADAQATKILLVESMAEYEALLKQQGHKLFNPALFDSARNEILCASDLRRLGEELQASREANEKLRADLIALERELRRKYGKLSDAQQNEFKEARRKILGTQEANNEIFARATARLFQTLYHEAFHSYLANFVYPPAEAEVPRWLNEGLAQIFETPVLDGSELFVGQPDADRLRRVQAALAAGEFLSLTDLLRAGADHFLVSHAGAQELSDRYYLASWALAYYLATHGKKLGSPELDRYVLALKKPGTEPLAAFEQFSGRPLPAFEKAYLQYLRKLKANGSSAKQ
jgi:hypothetical protein